MFTILGGDVEFSRWRLYCNVFTAPSTLVGPSKCPPKAVSSRSLQGALILLLC